MNDGVRIGTAVGLGYLLGRTRKMRLALMLVGVGVTGKLRKNPAGLVKHGIDALGSSPEVKTLTESVRGRLVEAGKAAAISAVSSQVDTLTDKIEQRTGSLSSPPVPGRAEETGEEAAEDTDEEERADRKERAGREERAGEEERERRASARRPRRPAERRPVERRPRRGRAESADEPTGRRPPPARRTRRREQ